MDMLNDQRYMDKPVILFFENFVLDAIGELPEDKEKVLQSLDLRAIFATQSDQWREVVRETLQLSPTIAISILDNWVRALDANPDIEPRQFAKFYVDDYFRDGSGLDVWTEQSLQEAVDRIKDYIIQGIERTGVPLAEKEVLEEAEA